MHYGGAAQGPVSAAIEAVYNPMWGAEGWIYSRRVARQILELDAFDLRDEDTNPLDLDEILGEGQEAGAALNLPASASPPSPAPVIGSEFFIFASSHFLR